MHKPRIRKSRGRSKWLVIPLPKHFNHTSLTFEERVLRQRAFDWVQAQNHKAYYAAKRAQNLTPLF